MRWASNPNPLLPWACVETRRYVTNFLMATTDYMVEMTKVIQTIKTARVVTGLILCIVFAFAFTKHGAFVPDDEEPFPSGNYGYPML